MQFAPSVLCCSFAASQCQDVSIKSTTQAFRHWLSTADAQVKFIDTAREIYYSMARQDFPVLFSVNHNSVRTPCSVIAIPEALTKKHQPSAFTCIPNTNSDKTYVVMYEN
jgi:hypothetical protein